MFFFIIEKSFLNIWIKVLEENTEINLNNHKLGNGFFGTTQKAQMMKEKKMDYSISNFCASNDTIKKIK